MVYCIHQAHANMHEWTENADDVHAVISIVHERINCTFDFILKISQCFGSLEIATVSDSLAETNLSLKQSNGNSSHRVLMIGEST